MKRKLGALEKVDADLPNLQHKIRRDPQSYQGDFENQWQQYQSMRELVAQNPTSAEQDNLISLRDLIDFVAHVADCYPKLTAGFAQDLSELLQRHHEQLEQDLREKLVGSLVLLRKKELIDSPTLLNTLFPLLIATPSKSLRTLVYQKIISDIRSSNAKTTNHKLNRTLQSILYNLLTSDRTSPKAIWAVRITRELWRRQIWTDSKAVEIMKEAALAENTRVIVGGVGFFLGGDREREEAAEAADSEDDEALDMGKLRHVAGISKKTKKKERDLKSAAAAVKKKERKKGKPHPLNFSALQLLHDPQSFAETLFSRHLQAAKTKLNLEQKLLVLNLVSRLVGLHELTIMSLYSYFLKFLTPRQASVTAFLAALAQSIHKRVPPDAIEPLLVKIANEFVSEAAASQVAAAGLNSIREICVRQPLAMNDTLLQDLVLYRKSKDKGVMMAAKGLLSLYREVGPDKLRRRDRGRDAALQMRDGERKEARFGEVAAGGIEGLDLLEKYKDEERRRKRIEAGLPAELAEGEAAVEDEEDEADWKAWHVEDDDSDSSTGWINVESEGEDIDISDSEDESSKHATKKQKLGATGTAAAAPASSTADQPPPQPPAEATPETTAPRPSKADNAKQAAASEAAHLSHYATTRILTPADLAKLNELRLQAAISTNLSGNKRQRQLQKKLQSQSHTQSHHPDDPVTAESLVATAALSHKATKEEKIAAAKGAEISRDGRVHGAAEKEKHGSTTSRRKEQKRAEGKSSTNKEKERKKNFLMTLGKARGKNKRSLREVGRTLKQHTERSKRGGKRGNRGM